MDDAETLRQEAVASQTAREKLLREKVEGVPQQLQYRARTTQQIEAQRLAETSIEKWARARNESPEQMRAAIEQRLEQDLSNPLAIRRGDRGALNVLEEGRFKTQFETGTSGGAFAPELRIEAEELGLGIPSDVKPSGRPVYGYVSDSPRTAGGYGIFEFQLKEEVKERTTITLGDSLVRFSDERLAGTPLRDPGMEGWGLAGLRYHDMGVGGIGYIEAQIQGGVTIDDIARLIIHDVQPAEGVYNPYVKQIRQAQKRGIEVIFASP